jgi:hypothetical protein
MFKERRQGSAPSESGNDRGSGSVLPKILGVVAVISILRMLASHKHGHGDASSWRDRRRSMIAELHRELHREDGEAANAPADGTAKA